jgi:NAD(P)-dependent dehydrogenase (short-subunit alcohol dehydrogenase family)
LTDPGLSGRNIVVTGATGALGRAVVALLVERGATCWLPVMEAKVPGHLPAGPAVKAATGVVLSDEAAVTRYFASVPPPWASIHCVGGFAMKPFTETTLADYEGQHTLNAVTAFLCCREAVRAMRMTGEGGRIVNVISRAALVPAGGTIAYTASKAEVAALTQALAAEVAVDRILVNAVAPAVIDSEANRKAMPRADFSTWAQPREIAETIAFLASPANTLTSGALVPVYGRA